MRDGSIKKLAVGFPWSSPFIWTDFVDGNMNLERPDGVSVRFFRGSGWCPARRHIHICEQALEWGADAICIIGSDQMHPEDMLVRLVDRYNQGHEVVSAMVPSRGYFAWQQMKPFQPMAWRFASKSFAGKGNGTLKQDTKIREYRNLAKDGDMMEVIIPEEGKDMERCNFIGSGVLMFHVDHLLALEKPWFKETINPHDMQRLASMDTTFVWRLQMEAHATVWIDTTIKVKHVHSFQIDETYQDRFGDWAKQGEGDPSVCRFHETVMASRQED